MSTWIAFQKFIAFGLVGLLVECFFTGIWSWFQKDPYGRVTTCLAMILPYGVCGLLLETVQFYLHWNIFELGLIYTCIIYCVEAGFGYVYKKLFGNLFWDYTGRIGSVFGYINLAYAPFWYILSLGFPFVSRFLHGLIRFLNVVQ